MQTHPDIAITFPDWIRIDEWSEIIEEVQTPAYSYLDALKQHVCRFGPGTFFRRNVLQIAGDYDANFPEIFDFEFYLRLGMYGYKFAHIHQKLATYRSHFGTTFSKLFMKL